QSRAEPGGAGRLPAQSARAHHAPGGRAPLGRAPAYPRAPARRGGRAGRGRAVLVHLARAGPRDRRFRFVPGEPVPDPEARCDRTSPPVPAGPPALAARAGQDLVRGAAAGAPADGRPAAAPGLRAEPALGCAGLERGGGQGVRLLERPGRAPQPALVALYRTLDARAARSLAGSGAADPVELSPRLRPRPAGPGYRGPGQGPGKGRSRLPDVVAAAGHPRPLPGHSAFPGGRHRPGRVRPYLVVHRRGSRPAAGLLRRQGRAGAESLVRAVAPGRAGAGGTRCRRPQLMAGPRERPICQATWAPWTLAVSRCPSLGSITGLQGTRLNPRPSSSRA